MNGKPDTQDRIWAVIAHLSAVAFGMGILLPIVGWSEQRRKSNYAAFHCLQALGYQSLGYTVWFLLSLLLMIAVIFAMAVSLGNAGESIGDLDAATGFWMIALFVVMLVLIGLYALFPVIAAIACALGRDFRYPVMGDRLARYLEYDPSRAGDERAWLIEDHEDRWVAAMGHFSVIIALWGMLAPLTAWILQGKRALFLKFQSIQTLVYQGLVALLVFGAGFVYMFGFVVFLALTGFEGDPSLDSPSRMVGLVVLMISMLVAALTVLMVPFFHILGQWAGYRVLKGDDFRYPVIGRLAEKWAANNVMLTPPDAP